VREKSRRRCEPNTGILYKRAWGVLQERGIPETSQGYPPFSEVMRDIAPTSHDPEVVHARSPFTLTTGRLFKAAWAERLIGQTSDQLPPFTEVTRALKPGSYDSEVVHERQADDGLVTMEQWCADVRDTSRRKFQPRTGVLFKKCWATLRERGIPQTSAEYPPFSEVSRELDPNSYDPEVVHARQAEYYLRKETPQRKAEVAANLLSEPAVRAEAAKPGSALRHAVAEASLAASRHDQGRKEHITANEPATGYPYERA
jgi:hypothetical protein